MGHSRASRDKDNARKREMRRAARNAKGQATPPDLAALVAATHQPIGFEALCDKLGKPPAAVRRLLEQADHAGIALQVGNNHVQLSPHEQIRTVQDSRIVPTEGARQVIGVLSDLHCGSKYCLRAQIQDCVKHFYERGIRAILIPGDLLDGCYKHGIFELSHTGLEDQTRDLCETLPSLPGLSYHAITGNHDHTFEDDAFNERCRTFDKADAEFLIAAARWFETFQEGIVKPASVPKRRAKVGRVK